MSASNKPVVKRMRLISGMMAPPPPPKHRRRVNQPPNNAHQDDPPNSLLRLNDDCLRDIFHNLDQENLCRLADVCTRMRPIAEQTFGKRYKEMRYEKFHMMKSSFRRIICKFGQHIISIDFWYGDLSEDEVNALVKYCPHLERMNLSSVRIDFGVAKSIFNRLKCLDIDRCDIINRTPKKMRLTNCPKLELFCMRLLRGDDLEFVANAFTNLIELKLNGVFATIESFAMILALNPKLQRLRLGSYANDIYIRAIVKHTRNLTVLDFSSAGLGMYSSNSPAAQQIEGFLQVSQLKKLTFFYYINENAKYKNVVAPLMTAFLRENVNLRDLHVDNFSIDFNAIKCIAKLKTIKNLFLGKIKCTPDHLVALVNELPSLTQLKLRFNFDVNFRPTMMLLNMVKAGKKLDSIEVMDIEDFIIDRAMFDALNKAAANRAQAKALMVTIKCCPRTTKVIVPIEIRHPKQQKLKFKVECTCRWCMEECFTKKIIPYSAVY